MATKKSDKLWSKVGVWSYVAGLVIAVLLALFSLFGRGPGLSGWAVGVLVVLGLIVGLLNISDDEVNTFLLAAIAFVVASSSMAAIFASLGSSFDWLQTFMSAIAVFTAPGALVVAFKGLYNVAKDD
jgi:hypothetical protein